MVCGAAYRGVTCVIVCGRNVRVRVCVLCGVFYVGSAVTLDVVEYEPGDLLSWCCVCKLKLVIGGMC